MSSAEGKDTQERVRGEEIAGEEELGQKRGEEIYETEMTFSKVDTVVKTLRVQKAEE